MVPAPNVACILRCEQCQQLIFSDIGNIEDINIFLIKSLSIGGLLYPPADMVNIVLVSYPVINDIKK